MLKRIAPHQHHRTRNLRQQRKLPKLKFSKEAMNKIIKKSEKIQTFQEFGTYTDELHTLTEELLNYCDTLLANDNNSYFEGAFSSAECTRLAEAAELLAQARKCVDQALTALQPEREMQFNEAC